MQGGVGAFTQELAKALAAQGHELHIITSRLARPPQERLPASNFWELVARADAWREPIPLGYAQLHPRGRRWRWADVSLVADIAQRYDLDVVNIQYQPAAYNMRSAAVNLLPWRLKGLAKSVVTFHDLRPPFLFPKAGRLREGVVRLMARQADGVIVTNQADGGALTAAHLTTPLRQIPIGSNITVHRASAAALAEVRRALNLRPSDVLLAYFGFINESKGADTLITALAGLDERHHLVFIGGQTGSSDTDNNRQFLDHLHQMIATLGVGERVHWTGFLPDKGVSAHLGAADMLVMPYHDGASLRRGTLMAGLAHGRALITTHPNHPLPELRHGENVWLVPPADATALGEAIRHLGGDTSLRAELGTAAQLVAEQFTWDKIAAQTAVFFEERLGER